VVSHQLSVYLRSGRWVGTLRSGRPALEVPRGAWVSLRTALVHGMEHIATGTDHLLFLLALVLVAPVAAERRRWSAPRGTRDALLAVARLVTAFTLGHSVTLVLTALGWVGIPAAPVEAAIAASIAVTALHAWRPIFPGREGALALAFGLVHGLAFGSVLAEAGLTGLEAAWTLLGFNGGIELAQLGLLALVVPWLLLLARTRAYAGARTVAALLTAALATCWLLERLAGLTNPAAPALAALEAHPFVALLALAGATLLALGLEVSASARRARSAPAPLR
jgi:hypothetical protein